MPNNIDGLINGINNQNLNYGNRDLLDLEKRMSKQDITSGLQSGLNFGIPSIAQAQNGNPYHNANNFTPNNQQPIVGVDMSQQDYGNLQKQGMLPDQLGMGQPQRFTPQDQQPAGQPIQQPQGQALPDIQLPQGAEQNPIITGASKQNPSFLRGLQDVYNGFRENADTPFSPQNLEQTKLADGRDKGTATHIGEALGTVGRGMNSSAGRGLMTGLLVAGTGGNPTQAMTYGMQAGLGNYQNVQQDKMNRSLLSANGVDTSNIGGYMNNENAKALTDNYYKLNGANYRMGKLSLDQVDQLRKAGLTEAQIQKLNADTEYTKGAKTDYTEAQTGLAEQRTETEKGRPALIKAQIKALNDRTGIMARRAAMGDSSAKRELQGLNIQKQRLLIEQNQLINQTLNQSFTSTS